MNKNHLLCIFVTKILQHVGFLKTILILNCSNIDPHLLLIFVSRISITFD